MKKQTGFTLLEVLVASLILFLAIALASVAYRAGIKTEVSAERKLFQSIAVVYIREAIVEEMRLKPGLSSGAGDWGRFLYAWEVTSKSEKWSKSGLDAETGTYVNLGRPLQLFTIKLEVGSDEYTFTHLSWK